MPITVHPHKPAAIPSFERIADESPYPTDSPPVWAMSKCNACIPPTIHFGAGLTLQQIGAYVRRSALAEKYDTPAADNHTCSIFVNIVIIAATSRNGPELNTQSGHNVSVALEQARCILTEYCGADPSD